MTTTAYNKNGKETKVFIPDTFHYTDEKNFDGTRTYTIFKNGEWNASFTSIKGEEYCEFLNRINEDVKKQTNGRLSANWD